MYISHEEGKYQLHVNNEPFFVKGAAGTSHFKELADAGANTIRTWDTTNIGVLLDSANFYGLKVMVGLPVVESYYPEFYSDNIKIDKQYSGIKSIVRKYKNHPALLLWICGNELDFPYRFSYNSFYSAFNNIIDMIHLEDENHPVTTSLVNFSRRVIINLLIKSPQLDFISINTFGGKLGELRKDLNTFEWFWDGPLLLTEWGHHGYWEMPQTSWNAPLENSSRKKAELYKKIYYRDIPFETGRMLGTCAFYWGQKQETTETWFSTFVSSGAPTESVLALNNIWTESTDTGNNYFPQLDKVEIENSVLVAQDTIIARTHFLDTCIECTAHWYLSYEDWYYSKYLIQESARVESGYSVLSQTADSAIICLPGQEGPYRLFVEVMNPNGNVATANIPLYILCE